MWACIYHSDEWGTVLCPSHMDTENETVPVQRDPCTTEIRPEDAVKYEVWKKDSNQDQIIEIQGK